MFIDNVPKSKTAVGLLNAFCLSMDVISQTEGTEQLADFIFSPRSAYFSCIFSHCLIIFALCLSTHPSSSFFVMDAENNMTA